MKTYTKIVLVLILLLALINPSRSAYAGETAHIQIFAGAGYAYHGVRDQGLSPMYYSGSNIFLNAGYTNQTGPRLKRLNLNSVFGTINPGIYPELTSSGISSTQIGINYDQLRLTGITFHDQLKMLLGGSFNSQFVHYKHNLYSNSSVTSYFRSTAEVSAALSYPVKKSDNLFLISFQANVPLIAFIIRPSYAYIKPKGFLNHKNNDIESILRSIEVLFPGKYRGLSSDLSITYDNGSGYSLQAGYRWQYIKLRDENILETATHAFFIKAILNR